MAYLTCIQGPLQEEIRPTFPIRGHPCPHLIRPASVPDAFVNCTRYASIHRKVGISSCGPCWRGVPGRGTAALRTNPAIQPAGEWQPNRHVDNSPFPGMCTRMYVSPFSSKEKLPHVVRLCDRMLPQVPF